MSSIDEDILARTVYGEARGEGDQGMKAVACVVMNRVALADQHPHFGDGTAAGACQAPWQFSCWNENDPNSELLQNVTDADPVFAKCLGIASDAINGLLTDYTNNATYYYVRGSAEPAWAVNQEPCAIIGRHLFFKGIA